MAILARGNDNWNALAALIERVGTANVLYAIACINRDKLGTLCDGGPDNSVCDDTTLAALNKTCGIVEKAANDAARHCQHRTGQVAS